MTTSGKGAKTATRMISAPSAGSTGREEKKNTISLFAFGSSPIRRRFGVLSWVLVQRQNSTWIRRSEVAYLEFG